jgi:hypothetical protein
MEGESMKTVYYLVLIAVLLASCSSAPPVNAIQTAIAQTQSAVSSLPTATVHTPTSTVWDIKVYKTQAAMTQAAKPTNTPRPTSTHGPTNTAKPTQRPTITPIPKTTYILETGWCMLDVSIDEVSGKDPKTVQWCNLDARKQVELAQDEYMTLTLRNLDGQIQVYCALFSLDGTFIMSDMDTTGAGKVTCPHE